MNLTTTPPSVRVPPSVGQYVDAGLATAEQTATLLSQVKGLKLQELNAIFRGLGIDSPSKSPQVVAQEEAPAAPAFAPLRDVASVASTPPAQLQAWEAAGAYAWAGRGPNLHVDASRAE